ncbi:MAG: hypothetical protein J0I29_16085 [Rhizobiales bacterium]|nr:hypothetical protein [Hyphomicrobiales bacterium]
MSTLSKNVCIACGQRISLSATVCPTCKSYQANWRNWLQYLSGIVALIAISVTALSWAWTNLRATFFYKDDVRLISLNSITSAVVANFGDGEIFISHIILTMPGRSRWTTPRLVFEERVSPGQFARKEFRTEFDKEKNEIIRGYSDANFDLLVEKAMSNSCYNLVFFSENDATFSEIQQMAGSTLNTFQVGGYLQYWSTIDRKAKKLPIAGKGIVRKNC